MAIVLISVAQRDRTCKSNIASAQQSTQKDSLKHLLGSMRCYREAFAMHAETRDRLVRSWPLQAYMMNIDVPGEWDANDWMALLGGAWLRLTPSQQDARMMKLFDRDSSAASSRMPPLPCRDEYADDEAFFEARYEWQSRVGRMIAAARIRHAAGIQSDDGVEDIRPRDALDAAFHLWEQRQVRQ